LKVLEKLLMVLVLLATGFYAFRVLSVHSAYVYWEDRKNAEELRIGDDRTYLNEAYDAYFARRQAVINLQSGELQQRIAGLDATYHVLAAHKADATDARDSTVAAVDSMRSLVRDELSPLPGIYDELLRHLRESQSRRLSSYGDTVSTNQDLMKELHNLYGEAGRARENYLRLEFAQYSLQEELRLRQDRLARYRYLAPDLQQKLGDNGNLGIQGMVVGSTAYGVTLDVGQRVGVERYQKFGVYRSGRLVAIVNVVSLQNLSSQAEVIESINGNQPGVGDVVIPLRY